MRTSVGRSWAARPSIQTSHRASMPTIETARATIRRRSVGLYWPPEHQIAWRDFAEAKSSHPNLRLLMTIPRKAFVVAVFVAVVATLVAARIAFGRIASTQGLSSEQVPTFEVDPLWPKPLPNHWILGQTIGVSIDGRDHIW